MEVGHPLATAHRTGKSPAFQFYPKDFLSSTKVQRMSLTEVGAYTMLLAYCWLDGSITADVRELARILKVPPKQFERMWAGPLSECFTPKSGRLVNERLEDERRTQAKFRAKMSENGKKGGRPKAAGSFGLSQSKADESSAIRNPLSASSSTKKEQEHTRGLGAEFARFAESYPDDGRNTSALVYGIFAEARQSVALDVMLGALENHKASERWLVAKKIPNMKRWLEEQRWDTKLPSVDDVAQAKAEAKLPAWARSSAS
jgi:uncharacterized protein YdaU (DUF1376 family)